MKSVLFFQMVQQIGGGGRYGSEGEGEGGGGREAMQTWQTVNKW